MNESPEGGDGLNRKKFEATPSPPPPPPRLSAAVSVFFFFGQHCGGGGDGGGVASALSVGHMRFLSLLFVFRMQILSELDKELFVCACAYAFVRGTDYTAVCQCRYCLRNSLHLILFHSVASLRLL